MPQTTAGKNRGFNLIQREVLLREDVKYERDWYLLFNFLIICMVLSLSFLSFLLKLNLESNIKSKQAELADKINTTLNNDSKSIIRSRISSLEDKYDIYQSFQEQNFDVNAFYNEVKGLYPGLKIVKFVVQPDSNIIDLSVRLEGEGYQNVPEFLQTLQKNDRFKKATVKNINFVLKTESTNQAKKTLIENLNTSQNFITEVSLSIEKKPIENTAQ